jgi:hypothetical protein
MILLSCLATLHLATTGIAVNVRDVPPRVPLTRHGSRPIQAAPVLRVLDKGLQCHLIGFRQCGLCGQLLNSNVASQRYRELFRQGAYGRRAHAIGFQHPTLDC